MWDNVKPPNYIDNNQNKETIISKPPEWVAAPSALQHLAGALQAAPTIAVDTESDSLYSYFEKVCLLQFSTRTEDYVVDPLAFESVASLGPVFGDAAIQKVFHAAEYDILCMKRDYGFEFKNIFDTMIAARILGWKNIGLGSILQERFGVTLNKKMQRADWGQRPLTLEQIAYARDDTHYLLALRDLQRQELDRLGRLEEATEEFERLTLVQATPRQFDPDAYWNLDGARALDPISLGILRELFRFRDSQARSQDRPPFKILSDSTLLRLSTAHPTSLRQLERTGGVSTYAIQRYGGHLLRAVERGRASPQTTPPHPRARGQAQLDNPARARLGRLKEWRKEKAAARGVAPDVIVSNDVLYELARRNPRTLETLVEAGNLGPWKARAYAGEMLSILHGKRKSRAE